MTARTTEAAKTSPCTMFCGFSPELRPKSGSMMAKPGRFPETYWDSAHRYPAEIREYILRR
jgi:hypothetical protein